MTRDQALSKIKKLLRMAGSSNPNEAAIAMRQANVLMAQYQLSASDAAGVEEAVHVVRGKTARISMTELIAIIRRLYGAEAYIRPMWNGKGFQNGYTFVSDKPGTAEICQYAMAVLARQLRRDCTVYLSRVRLAKNRAARGDVFGIGWCRGLRDALKLEDVELVVSDAVKQHMATLGTVKAEVKARKNKSVSFNDRMAGFAMGQKAKLHTGVNRSRAALDFGRSP